MIVLKEMHHLLKLRRIIKLKISQIFGLDWKNQKYRQGPSVEKDVSIFFTESIQELS